MSKMICGEVCEETQKKQINTKQYKLKSTSRNIITRIEILYFKIYFFNLEK